MRVQAEGNKMAPSGSDGLLAGELASPARAWGIVLLLGAILAVGMADRVILSTLIGPIKADLHLTDAAFGLVQGTAVAIFYVVFAFPIGWMADRYDRRWILFSGIVVWSLAAASCGLVGSFAGLFAARCLVGAGEAVIGPAGYPMIASLVDRRRMPLAMTTLYLGGTFGLSLGQVIGGSLFGWLSRAGTAALPLVNGLAPWRTVFLLTGLPGLVLAALTLLAPRDRTTAARVRATNGGFAAFFRDHRRFYLLHNIGMGLQQAAIVSAILWNGAYMGRTFGWSPAWIGAVFGTLVLVTSTVAVVGHGWVVGREFERGRRDFHLRWQLSMSLLAAPFWAVGYLWHSPVAACAGFGLANLLTGGSIVVAPTALQIATPPDLRGRISALYVVLATLIGTAVGPSLVGFATDWLLHDERKVGVALAGCCVLFSLGAVALLAAGLPPARRVMGEADARRAGELRTG